MAQTRLVSADSHVAETEDVFREIDPRYRSARPRAAFDEKLGAVLCVPELEHTIPMGLICTGGRPPEDFARAVRWEELHPAGHDPRARLAIQESEGVSAEVLYPSVGMVLCGHPDADYKKACFDAYNRWLAGFCETAPERLIGIPVATCRSVVEGIGELESLAAQGFRGVMLPGDPVLEDYDARCWDPLWEACCALELPVSFHIVTTRRDFEPRTRGPKLAGQVAAFRGVQDILLMLVLGGVFERHPALRVVCVEAEAGWVPHLSQRMDHSWRRHRHWAESAALAHPPSHYVDANLYFTFQDDRSLRWVSEGLNWGHLLWASDFPHSDGTYPHTAAVVAELTAGMSDARSRAILSENVEQLYHLA